MKNILYISLILIFTSAAFADKDVRVYKSIEFKNINYLSKYEIIDQTDINFKGDNILLDINSLERALNDSPMVKSFKLNEENQSLIINIIENEPIYLLVLRDIEKNTLIELDSDMHVISINKVHSLAIPPVVVSKEDAGKNISPRIMSFLRMINDLNAGGLRVIKEISEINFTDINKVKVSLKGRRTIFIIRPNKESFNKMNYAAGYFDRIRYYPHYFSIFNDAGILE